LTAGESLLGLIRKMERIEDLGRIRLSSLDPRFLGEDLLEHITSSDKVCPHFHLSLQHGSDRILERMGRRISVERYEDILSRLRSRSPNAALGADILVGFPGETEEDFRRTAVFLEASHLSYFHVFTYSPRPGTPASLWPQVPSRFKTERSAHLRKISKKKNILFRRRFLDKLLPAVVIETTNGVARVLTSNYLSVQVPDGSLKAGEEIDVRVTQVTEGGNRGKPA
jgi:threonylcarbamoyladenosine tRNA methylthiotransferase MtaB